MVFFFRSSKNKVINQSYYPFHAIHDFGHLPLKITGADIPNGSQLNLDLLNSVMNVVNNDDSNDSSVCQNPELACSFEKYLASPIWAKMLSTDGKRCLSLLDASV